MNKMKFTILSFILKLVLNLIFLTCSWKVHNIKHLNNCIKENKPLLLCSWHQRFLYVAKYFQNFTHPIWAISSTHKDSEIMASVLKTWKWSLVRGSSSRGWRNVIIKMSQLFKNNNTIIAITNDGPKGPPKIAKKGSINLAVKARANIVAMSCTSSSFWKLNSWDSTYIPKPFSTIHVYFSKPLKYDEQNKNESKVINLYLNNSLKKLNEII